MSFENDTKANKIICLLFNWLEKRNSKIDLAWLNRQAKEIYHSASEKTLFTSFSAASRYLNQDKLDLSSEELRAALALETGWNPTNWTLEQVGRTILLLSFSAENATKYLATLDKIIEAADVGEVIACYQSLSLLPYPKMFQLRAAEGVRSNMTSVFNAVALNNTYPAQYLDNLAWNQMVLKALFVGSSLKFIYGLERRNNQQLSQMLVDYACERLSANRTVSSELWELVMPFQPETVARLRKTTIEV